MPHQIVLLSLACGALVGWLTALLVVVPPVLTEGSPGLVMGTLFVLVHPALVGLTAGALAGVPCGLVAALAVGRRNDPRSALPRAALGAMTLPAVIVVATQAWLLLLPAGLATVLLVSILPGVLAEPRRRRRDSGTVRP